MGIQVLECDKLRLTSTQQMSFRLLVDPSKGTANVPAPNSRSRNRSQRCVF